MTRAAVMAAALPSLAIRASRVTFAPIMKYIIALLTLVAFVTVPALRADEGKPVDKDKPACTEKAKGCCPAGEKKEGCCPKDGAGDGKCPASKDAPPEKK